MSNFEMQRIHEDGLEGIWLVKAPTVAQAAIHADLNLPASQRIKSIAPVRAGEFIVVSTAREWRTAVGRREATG